LRDSIAGAQTDGPLQLASWAADKPPKMGNDPGLSLVRMFSSAGVMKAALGDAGNGASGRYTLVEP
jgi:hypothetical protein